MGTGLPPLSEKLRTLPPLAAIPSPSPCTGSPPSDTAHGRCSSEQPPRCFPLSQETGRLLASHVHHHPPSFFYFRTFFLRLDQVSSFDAPQKPAAPPFTCKAMCYSLDMGRCESFFLPGVKVPGETQALLFQNRSSLWFPFLFFSFLENTFFFFSSPSQ